MAWLTPEEILRTPVEQLGLLILHRLQEVDDGWSGSRNFIVNYFAEARDANAPYPGALGTGQIQNQDAVEAKLSEAWSWLDRAGYVMTDERAGGGQWRTLTTTGRETLSRPVVDVLRRIRAGKLLPETLHPRIEAQARADWNAGDFESAIFKSCREVEIAVREALGLEGTGLIGVGVINAAFGSNGPLVDAGQDPGEREGTRAAYAGLIGAFKNPGSHRHFSPDDPVQAAEIIGFADLLMRMLGDRVAQLGSGGGT